MPYPFTCGSCEEEITRPYVIHVGVPFCCEGCAVGGPCSCTYDEAFDRPAAVAVTGGGRDAAQEVPVEPAPVRPGDRVSGSGAIEPAPTADRRLEPAGR